MQLQGDRLVPWSEGPPEGGHYDQMTSVRSATVRTRRSVRLQPDPDAPAGQAACCLRATVPPWSPCSTRIVTDGHTLYGPDTRGLVMAREESFDIDDAFDLEVAERLMASRT